MDVPQSTPFHGVPATGNRLIAQPQTQGGSAVGKSILNSNIVNTVMNIFSGPNSGVNQSTLHALLQGQPGTGYQNIVNTLMLKQQQPRV